MNVVIDTNIVVSAVLKDRDLSDIAAWELRVGVFRVFYNVDDHVSIVRIERIGYKPNNTIFFRKRRGGRS